MIARGFLSLGRLVAGSSIWQSVSLQLIGAACGRYSRPGCNLSTATIVFISTML